MLQARQCLAEVPDGAGLAWDLKSRRLLHENRFVEVSLDVGMLKSELISLLAVGGGGEEHKVKV